LVDGEWVPKSIAAPKVASKPTTKTGQTQVARASNDTANENNEDDDQPTAPLRTDIHIVYCTPKPGGSPGRGGYCLQDVLGMGDGDYNIVKVSDRFLLVSNRF
jgi:hypothetical protein